MADQKLNVTVLGAGGKMGTRVTNNLKQFDCYNLMCCEAGEAGAERVKSRGLKVYEEAEAIKSSSVVVMAVPDSYLKKISEHVVPMLNPDTTVVILDPAAAYAKELTLRPDCTFVVVHPSHPPLYMKQDSDEAREDSFGGIAAKQDIILALIQGKEENYAKGEKVCKDMFKPINKAFRVTVDQLAFLEPACSETVGGTCCYVLSQVIEEAVKAGIDREIATDFMLGHINVLLALYTGKLDSQPSDACKVAVKCGLDLVFKDTWRDAFKVDVNKKVVATMLEAGRK